MIANAPFIKAEKASCCAYSSRIWGYYSTDSLNLFRLDYASGKWKKVSSFHTAGALFADCPSFEGEATGKNKTAS